MHYRVQISRVLLLAAITTATGLSAQAGQADPIAQAVAGLALRGVGPAVMGGRIADIAVHPHKSSTWYVAVGSWGLWKTTNAGITWTPVFEDQPS